MDFECAFVPELTTLASRPALTIRTRTRVSNIAALFGKGYAAIAQLLQERGTVPAGPPFALYYNMDMDDLEVEFGFPVDALLQGSGSITASATPSGKAVTTLYIVPERKPLFFENLTISPQSKAVYFGPCGDALTLFRI